ncbi:MAG: PP2C family protein-serine/threonine phosphatase [Boseongicola sp.]
MSVDIPVSLAETAQKIPLPILIVDDSMAQRRLLARALSRWGYTTIEAESGEAAIELCHSVDVDFVVSDWMMPGMSGIEFCQKFREIKQDRPAYFILLTAQTDRETLAEGLENGADDFLSKPFNVVELKARIRAGKRMLTSQRDILDKNQLLSTALDELQKVYSAVDRDLREARSFQQALVPDQFHVLPGGNVSFLYRPSGHVGGDLVGMFRVSDTRYGVFSVDVAGHGVASALMTARIAGHLSASSPDRNLALTTDRDGRHCMLPSDEVCRRLNSLLLNEMETDRYLTMVLADVDLDSGKTILAQAGHPSPAVQRADGSVEFVSSYGMPIGLIPDAEFSSFVVQLAPGDRLLLYSDGITECPTTGVDMLGEEGLNNILQAYARIRGPSFLEQLVADLRKQSGLTEFPDDLSGILIERDT